MAFKLKECNLCGSKELIKTKNEVIYGKRYGHGKIIMCEGCGEYVGCHANGKPLGLIANQAMREMKVLCHESFDRSWRMGYVSRSEAYRRLSVLLGISPKDCHFGHFDIDRLNQAYSIVSKRRWFDGVKNE